MTFDCLTACSSITWKIIIKLIRPRDSSDEFHLKVRSKSGQTRLNFKFFLKVGWHLHDPVARIGTTRVVPVRKLVFNWREVCVNSWPRAMSGENFEMFKVLVTTKFRDRVVNYSQTARELVVNSSWTRRDDAMLWYATRIFVVHICNIACMNSIHNSISSVENTAAARHVHTYNVCFMSCSNATRMKKK